MRPLQFFRLLLFIVPTAAAGQAKSPMAQASQKKHSSPTKPIWATRSKYWLCELNFTDHPRIGKRGV